jgi:NAD(P)-dependent dehydrogenase (short-subunit alcohol dehydrogenase family)
MAISNGPVALITGSSRGIGRAIALAFARTGASVAVTYNQRATEAEETLAQVISLGGQGCAIKVDVSSRAGVHRMKEVALDNFGRIDVLVNNAGILQQKPFLTISDEDWEAVLNTNLKGTFLCSQEIFSTMQQQGRGRIINIASSGGQLGGPLAVHYSASKAGVICLTKSLARIGAPTILVNCIAPGLIETEMTRDEVSSEAGKSKMEQILLKRAGLADEVASAALFLASDQASYITGQTINVNGGLYLG